MIAFKSLKAFALLCVAVTTCQALVIPTTTEDSQLAKRCGEDAWDDFWQPLCCCEGLCGLCTCQGGFTWGSASKTTPSQADTVVFKAPEVQMISTGGPIADGQKKVQDLKLAEAPMSSPPKMTEMRLAKRGGCVECLAENLCCESICGCCCGGGGDWLKTTPGQAETRVMKAPESKKINVGTIADGNNNIQECKCAKASVSNQPVKTEARLARRGFCDECCDDIGDCICCDCCCGNCPGSESINTPGQAENHVLKAPEVQKIVTGNSIAGETKVPDLRSAEGSASSQPVKNEVRLAKRGSCIGETISALCCFECCCGHCASEGSITTPGQAETHVMKAPENQQITMGISAEGGKSAEVPSTSQSVKTQGSPVKMEPLRMEPLRSAHH